jgi:probable phosphoglycerate mutase
MGKLILVRHAESVGNRMRRFTMDGGSPLTELGREQARQAAALIRARFKPELLVSSPYRRALETAAIIGREIAYARPPLVVVELCERDFGQLKGRPYDAVHDDPAFRSAVEPLWKPPGGESLEEVRLRTAPALEKLARDFPDIEVVVVSHGGVMTALCAHLNGGWEGVTVPENCAVLLVENFQGRLSAPTPVAPLK